MGTSTLKQLRELAEAVNAGDSMPICLFDPDTLLALLDLIELQHEALSCHADIGIKAEKALSTYNALNKEAA